MTSLRYGRTWIAIPYFVIFIILTNFLMVNLFIAVIMDNFEYLTQDASTLNVHHLDRFAVAWQGFDPAGHGKLPPGILMELFKRLPPPLGFGVHCSHNLAWINLMKMNPSLDKDGLVTFNAALLSLIRMRLDVCMDRKRGWDHENTKLAKIIRKVWPVAALSRPSPSEPTLVDQLMPPPTDATSEITTAGQLFAIHWMQRILRAKYQAKKKQERQFVAGPPTGYVDTPTRIRMQRAGSMDDLPAALAAASSSRV